MAAFKRFTCTRRRKLRALAAGADATTWRDGGALARHKVSTAGGPCVTSRRASAKVPIAGLEPQISRPVIRHRTRRCKGAMVARRRTRQCRLILR